MAILTISREFGSGGHQVGRNIADSLDYKLLEKDRIFQDIKASCPQWEEWARELDEHDPTLWERYDWSFKGFGALIQSMILEHALHDRIVIMGRGGSFLLKDISHALRVRIVAPLDIRIARIISRDCIDAATARRLVERADRERNGFVNAIYDKPIGDVSEYDITFDTGNQSHDEIVQHITALLEEKDRLKSEQSINVLQVRAKTARFRATLLTDPSLSTITTLDLAYEDSHFVLRGIVRNPKEHQRVEETARRITQCEPFRCELRYRA